MKTKIIQTFLIISVITCFTSPQVDASKNLVARNSSAVEPDCESGGDGTDTGNHC